MLTANLKKTLRYYAIQIGLGKCKAADSRNLSTFHSNQESEETMYFQNTDSYFIHSRGRRMRPKDETSDRFTMMNQCGDSPQGLEMLPQGWNLQQFGQQYNKSGK